MTMCFLLGQESCHVVNGFFWYSLFNRAIRARPWNANSLFCAIGFQRILLHAVILHTLTRTLLSTLGIMRHQIFVNGLSRVHKWTVTVNIWNNVLPKQVWTFAFMDCDSLQFEYRNQAEGWRFRCFNLTTSYPEAGRGKLVNEHNQHLNKMWMALWHAHSCLRLWKISPGSAASAWPTSCILGGIL